MAAGIPLRALIVLLLWSVAGVGIAYAADDLPLEPSRRIALETDTATWMSLDVHPDGSSIVTDILGDLYLIPITGGEARQLTSGMGFDSQPAFSADGRRLVFVSDRSGAESLWIANADGSGARRISLGEDDIWVSPAWSPDSRFIFASRFLPNLASYELWRFEADRSGAGTLLIPAKVETGVQSSLGVWPTSDGRAILFARAQGRLGDELPAWSIVKHDIATGAENVLVWAPASPRTDLILGSFFRPVLSPDGRLLVYGSRHEGQTGLRLLDLETGADRWLVYPAQHDEAQASAWLDLLPRYDFTPDGKSVIFTREGRIDSITVRDGRVRQLPFTASLNVELGPNIRTKISEDTGPVRARIIQHPVPSPDGRRIAFSALGRIYVQSLKPGARPQPLTAVGTRAFMPSWSPDGRHLTYVTWTARDAGHVWTLPASGDGRPRRLSSRSAYYTFPVFAPDGRTVLAVRSSSSVRMRSYMEYGPHRQADLVALSRGRAARVIASGEMGGRPQFGPEGDAVYLAYSDGLNRVPLDGSPRARIIEVTGPGWYFSDAPATADDMRISPDGRWLLAQLAQQLHLIQLPSAAGATVKVDAPTVFHRKLTDVGADFLEWSGDGRTIHWSLGSTFYSLPLSEATAALSVPGAAVRVREHEAIVEVPRDIPEGAILLRGATLLTMHGSEVVENADLLVVRDRIAAIGARGSFPAPQGTAVRELAGRFIMPGLIDTHDHYADIRRGVLDFESWGPRANLAYGVTTGFDPSTLSIDTIAYEDAVAAGLMTGSRMPSTGPAIFSFNRFGSLDEVRSVLRRYREHYKIRNLKQYRSGNRRVRQWLVQAARELEMLPTTEGALSLKLDLTQILDGYPGHEHALPVVPLGKDVVELLARSGTSYTATLQIGNGGPEAQDYFITREPLSDDAKLNRFAPRFVVNVKTRERRWRHFGEYFFPAVAAEAARIKRSGGIVGMGSHGEMPGIGMHWEMEAHVLGGMTPMEALHSATMGSAATIGRDHEFGSLEAGKFADLVILRSDPRVDIRNSLSIEHVMKNGRLYDGETLEELWPTRRRLPEAWYRRDDPPGGSVTEFPKPPDFENPHGHTRRAQ